MPNQPIHKEHAALAVVMALVLSASFYATDQFMAAQMLKGNGFFSPALPWDVRIPFTPGWIWVYLTYFPICFIPLAFQELWTDRAFFKRTALGFFLQFAVGLAFFWLLPSKMERPLVEAAGLTGLAVHWFYRLDAGFNIFPSLHVANVAYIACLAWRVERKVLSGVVWMLCALIGLSTLFVKQHYLLDLPPGVLLGVFGYFAAFSNFAGTPGTS